MANKTQPGITVDSDIWKEFKEKYSKNASQKVEELMKSSLDADNPAALFSSNGVENISFVNPDQWNLSFTDSKIQLTNMTYSCSADGSGSTTNTVDGEGVNVYSMDAKNIEIE